MTRLCAMLIGIGLAAMIFAIFLISQIDNDL